MCLFHHGKPTKALPKTALHFKYPFLLLRNQLLLHLTCPTVWTALVLPVVYVQNNFPFSCPPPNFMELVSILCVLRLERGGKSCRGESSLWENAGNEVFKFQSWQRMSHTVMI